MSGGGALSGVRSWPAPEDLRSRVIAAVIAEAAANGAGDLTLQAVLDRAETNNRAFHRHFDDLEAALVAAYEERAEQLCTELLEAGRLGEDWQSGLRAALELLGDWVRREPQSAAFVLVEYRSAGPRVLALHEQKCHELELALDRARAEIPADRQPPGLAAAFVIGAIESEVSKRLYRGAVDQVGEAIPTLAFFGALIFMGYEPAKRELG